ncbi:MAG: hypothetical protein GXY05_16685 [Clostridiales bacterium]|nr:hypothetical protein [Clostridiales bacterium]
MGKILFTLETENGQTNYIAGTVEKVREGTGAATGRVRNVLVNLSVYENNTFVHKQIDIALWNDSKNPDDKRKQLATRAQTINLSKGDFMLFICGNITEKGVSASNIPQLATRAFGFEFNMRRTVEVDTVKGLFNNEILCGIVRRMNLAIDRPYITVPINTFKDGEKGSDWVTIFLKDSDENIKKYVQEGTPIACVTSEIRENIGENGYKSLTCSMFQYVLGQARKTKKASA